jgi:hypothetical protein
MSTTITVSSSLEATRIAGGMAGKMGGVWTHNPDCTMFVVARTTSPRDLMVRNRWLTIKVKPEAEGEPS